MPTFRTNFALLNSNWVTLESSLHWSAKFCLWCRLQILFAAYIRLSEPQTTHTLPFFRQYLLTACRLLGLVDSRHLILCLLNFRLIIKAKKLNPSYLKVFQNFDRWIQSIHFHQFSRGSSWTGWARLSQTFLLLTVVLWGLSTPIEGDSLFYLHRGFCAFLCRLL